MHKDETSIFEVLFTGESTVFGLRTIEKYLETPESRIQTHVGNHVVLDTHPIVETAHTDAKRHIRK